MIRLAAATSNFGPQSSPPRPYSSLHTLLPSASASIYGLPIRIEGSDHGVSFKGSIKAIKGSESLKSDDVSNEMHHRISAV